MTDGDKRNASPLEQASVRPLQQIAGWGLCTTDRQLRITGWSQWLEQSSGRRAADLSGRNLLEVFPELVERGLDGLFRQALAGQVISLPQGRHPYLMRMPSSDARYECMAQSARIAPLTENGSIVGTLTIIEDVTERAAQRAADEMRKNEFLAMLAHELRNPLAPILCGIELLRMTRAADSETQMAVDIIERQTLQMTRLIDDLLDVARVTHRTIKLRCEAVELADVIVKAVETCRPLIDARRHALRLDLATGPLTLRADAPRLVQVIGNLLNNAAKYTPEGGQITLVTRREGPSAVVVVGDTGIGIAPAMLEKVFDLFTQVDASLDRSLGGLGIGLNMSRSLVEMHGGQLVGRSAGLDQGSEFEVRLPLLAGQDAAVATGERAATGEPATTGKQAASEEPVTTGQWAAAGDLAINRDSIARSAEAPSPSAAARPRRVLVVDDNVDGAKLLGMLLETLGCAVQVAYDGPQALQQADAWRPDVVLLDIGLPEIDGYEVARRLRQSPTLSRVPLVALTGYSGEEDRRRSAEAGFDHHLVKPVMLESLNRLFKTM